MKPGMIKVTDMSGKNYYFFPEDIAVIYDYARWDYSASSIIKLDSGVEIGTSMTADKIYELLQVNKASISLEGTITHIQ